MLLPLIVGTCAFPKRTHPGILEHFADMCRAAMPGSFFDPPSAQDGAQPMPLRWKCKHPAALAQDGTTLKLYLALGFVELCLKFPTFLASSIFPCPVLPYFSLLKPCGVTYIPGTFSGTQSKTSHFQYGTCA